MSTTPESTDDRPCEQCGDPIGIERIEALPRTRTCIDCARMGAQRPSRGQMCR